jgi:cytochrome P450
MTTTEALSWDPFDPALALDPYPLYARLREEAPLYHNAEHDFYAVSRHTDVQRGLADWETYSSSRGDILEIIQANVDIPPGTLIFEDPPVHDIHRRLLARVFTPRRIAELEPQIREFCTTVLEPVTGAERFDLVEAVGAEMPMRVIGMLLGIPEADQATYRDRTDSTI